MSGIKNILLIIIIMNMHVCMKINNIYMQESR